MRRDRWHARAALLIWSLLIWAVLTLPPVRRAMEADMVWHMLVQFPAIAFGGLLFARGLPAGIRERAAYWNPAGFGGLFAASLIAMFWMIPRALDSVLIDGGLEIAKFVTLALAGGLFQLSWKPAGLIVQGVFAANVLPMMMVIGWLYIAAPVRLCNAYLGSQQRVAGEGLIVLAMIGCLYWLLGFFRPVDAAGDVGDMA